MKVEVHCRSTWETLVLRLILYMALEIILVVVFVAPCMKLDYYCSLDYKWWMLQRASITWWRGLTFDFWLLKRDLKPPQRISRICINIACLEASAQFILERSNRPEDIALNISLLVFGLNLAHIPPLYCWTTIFRYENRVKQRTYCNLGLAVGNLPFLTATIVRISVQNNGMTVRVYVPDIGNASRSIV